MFVTNVPVEAVGSQYCNTVAFRDVGHEDLELLATVGVSARPEVVRLDDGYELGTGTCAAEELDGVVPVHAA